MQRVDGGGQLRPRPTADGAGGLASQMRGLELKKTKPEVPPRRSVNPGEYQSLFPGIQANR